MPDALSRLQRIAAAAKAQHDAQHAALKERAAAGDRRAITQLERLAEREQRGREFMEAWQRRFQQRVDQQAARSQRRNRLQPADVVAAALDLLDAKGLDGVTLRDVAGKVHVQAPALYWHFANKKDLVDAMAQAILIDFVGALEPPQDASAWRPWLRQSAHGLRAAMLARRDGGRVVAGAGLGRARALAGLIAMSLRVMEASGFDPVTGSSGTRAVIAYTFGTVIEEQSDPDAVAEAAEIEEVLREFPEIARAIDTQLQLSPTALFDLGLELILRGLEERK
jgi:TetR/AcrR family transcriptional regulator, tetracycline repressor protein